MLHLFIVIYTCIFKTVWSISCPSSWIVHENSCYHLSHDQETWPDAVFVCRLLGGHIAEIDSASENTFLTNRMKATSVWIGYSDLIEEGTWTWAESNTKSGYTNWSPTEPNNQSGEENCAELSKSGKWNDALCNILRHYVCEKESEDPVPIG